MAIVGLAVGLLVAAAVALAGGRRSPVVWRRSPSERDPIEAGEDAIAPASGEAIVPANERTVESAGEAPSGR
ncbi:MAG TPA: hypothetical protein VNJ28_00135 [Candidatus Limnocylindrales bacterium]|nr:hypothetical protein [Candidatus Limnocylindrales bacterium]